MLRKGQWSVLPGGWPVLSALLVLLLMGVLAYSQRLSDEFYQLVLRQRQHELREKVDLAYNAIFPLVEKCRRGELIEDAAVLNLARQCGCDYAQGYLLGRPLPPGQVQEMLAAGL